MNERLLQSASAPRTEHPREQGEGVLIPVGGRRSRKRHGQEGPSRECIGYVPPALAVATGRLGGVAQGPSQRLRRQQEHTWDVTFENGVAEASVVVSGPRFVDHLLMPMRFRRLAANMPSSLPATV